MFFRLYFRRFGRNRLSMVISLAGLVLGLTTSFLISLYLIHEITYDRFHKNSERIYKVLSKNLDHQFTQAQTSYLFGPAAKQEIPDVEDYCRIFQLYGSSIRLENQWLDENKIFSADSSIFSMFSFRFISGSAWKGSDIRGICISQSMALKYFGEEDPLDKTLMVKNKGREFLFTVRAVYKDFPDNSTFLPEALVPIKLGHDQLGAYLAHYGSDPESVAKPQEIEDHWDYCFYTTYLLLKEKDKEGNVLNGFRALGKKYHNKETHLEYSLQKLTDVYLHSDGLTGTEGTSGNLTNIYIFLIISILVLVASGLNYVLMATTRSIARIRDLGIRRVAGADRKSILIHFCAEALITNLIAVPLSIMLAELLLPQVNRILGTELAIYYTKSPLFLLVILLVPLLLAIITGSYVAMQVFRMSTAELVKNPLSGSRTGIVKRALIYFQIIIFVSLISCVLVIRNQIQKILQSDLGFQTKNIIIIPFPEENFIRKYESFKQELEGIPGIESVSGAFVSPPSRSIMSMKFDHPDLPGQTVAMEFLLADYNLIETLKMKILQGRSFSKEYPSDTKSIVLMESAVKMLDLKEPIGKQFPFGSVIGVVEDFYLHSLHEPVKPAYIALSPENMREILVRVEPGMLHPVTELLRKKIMGLTGKNEFRYSLFAEKLQDVYRTEIRLQTVLLIFTIISTLLALLGLFGLSSFTTEQRTKEIGIRKVNGASTFSLVVKLSSITLRIVFISVLLSVFPSWFFLSEWLSNFSVKTDISISFFILSGCMAMFITFLTTVGHAWRTALKNPVDSLRYE